MDKKKKRKTKKKNTYNSKMKHFSGKTANNKGKPALKHRACDGNSEGRRDGKQEQVDYREQLWSLSHWLVTKVGHNSTDKITRSAVTAKVSCPYLRHTYTHTHISTHKNEEGIGICNTFQTCMNKHGAFGAGSDCLVMES